MDRRHLAYYTHSVARRLEDSLLLCRSGFGSDWENGRQDSPDLQLLESEIVSAQLILNLV